MLDEVIGDTTDALEQLTCNDAAQGDTGESERGVAVDGGTAVPPDASLGNVADALSTGDQKDEPPSVATPVRDETASSERLLRAMDIIKALNAESHAGHIHAVNKMAEATGKSQAMLEKLVDKLCED